jgi:hypothetical protein
VNRCEECGFVYVSVARDEIADRLRSFGPKFDELLSGSSAALHERPEPEVWSAVEYGCHVRDVLLAQRERLYLALAEDTPDFASIYPDKRVEFARYNSESASQLVEELNVMTRLIADAFSALQADQWSRSCIYHYPTTAKRNLTWLGQHTIHEAEHHLIDIGKGLGRIG